MASFKRFEDLPVWRESTDLAVRIFKLTDAACFKYKGDLVNQLRRAALSVPNNIAEGFERGTTQELITFLYIARGSAGEVRSMLRFAIQLGAMVDLNNAITNLIATCESISRQIRAWLNSLQNTDITGNRYLNDETRKGYEGKKRAEAFHAQMQAFREQMEAGLTAGTWGRPEGKPNLKSEIPNPSGEQNPEPSIPDSGHSSPSPSL